MPIPAYHALVRPAVGDAPLVFAFHGTGGDELQFAGLIHRILPGAGIVAPRGDVLEHGARRFFRRTGEGVYDMDDLARRTEAMIAFTRSIRSKEPERAAFAMGYSNGANILASMSFADAALFDRMALLHPLVPWRPAANAGLRERSVLITAGRRDPIAPLALTQALAEYYRSQGSIVTVETHDGGHEIQNGEVAALARFFVAKPPRGDA